MKHSEKTPLTHFCTDRQGVPVAIDITGKTGDDKKTDNSNLFCLGSSGTGKSFNMNTILQQLIEQDTDVVVVDTGDSYEMLCLIYGGTYITYSKEHPISMNPFKITEEEYNENFGEKKNFLKSLIFLIYKGQEAPTKIEDRIINQTIVEYYEEYFHPFEGYTQEEREQLRERLMLEDKKNGEFQKYEEKLEEKYSDDYRIDELEDTPNTPTEDVDDIVFTEEEVEHHEKVKRQVEKLHAVIQDKAATDGEKAAANNQLMRLMPELIEGKYLRRLDKKIERMEAQRKKMKVKSLSFNTFYEYMMERIPQITSEKKIHFDINNFSSILEPFYRGGEMEYTLNNDVDSSLFDARFIVFEIDKIKDDATLFPIVVLIIMDVFLQKMRIKKGRKALIIEEAWKAISSPTMAEYIKYLYKTVRKFNGIAGVVTQELNDVIDSPIVKEAIISNSDIKILMDQSKFKDKYDEVAKVMGLTDTQRRQIFTINSLNNHDGRPYFKETWICRGHDSDVYGVEVPPEMCWAFTTERSEKEAVRLYVRYYENDGQRAIRQMEEDRKKLGVSMRDFANMVNQQKSVVSLWES
jgi:type IV secretory pathway VirB4 component